jgi:hypothetical protein
LVIKATNFQRLLWSLDRAKLFWSEEFCYFDDSDLFAVSNGGMTTKHTIVTASKFEFPLLLDL